MIELGFRDKAAFIFIVSALLLPSILLSKELVVVGGCIALFMLAQLTLLYLFYRQEEHGFEEWHAFWAVITGLFFVLVIILLGRGLQMEYIGFILFLCYFVSIVIFVFKDDIIDLWARARSGLERATPSASGAGVSEDDIKEFRGKDDLDRLIEEFEIPEPRKSFSELIDESRKQGSRLATRAEQEAEVLDSGPRPKGEEKPAADDEDYGYHDSSEFAYKPEEPESSKSYSFHDDDAETYVVNMIKARREEKEKEKGKEGQRKADELPSFKDYFSTEHSYSEEEEEELKAKEESSDKPRIVELKETPEIDFNKVKGDLERIDSGVKTISQKIREISEKAIKEGEEKKRRIAERAASTKVFVSTTGNKYHHDRGCVALKRVAKKNIRSFADSALARKKGLRACGLCRK
ncbi:MAG: hypothetical protein V1866_01425 [archaeon]